jgi:hypothetical protein
MCPICCLLIWTRRGKKKIDGRTEGGTVLVKLDELNVANFFLTTMDAINMGLLNYFFEIKCLPKRKEYKFSLELRRTV